MAENVEIDEFIQFLNSLQKLSPESKNSLSKICSSIRLDKSVILQEIGQTCRTIYFVQEGMARIYYYRDGIEVTEYFAAARELIIRAESLFTNQPSKKGIITVTDTVFIALPAGLLFNLFDEFPEIERLFRIIIQDAYVETIKRIESMQFHSAEERYKNLLQESPSLIQQVPLKHIASFLGITQVSLSRIRSSLSKQ
jgi:CRP-like cAMP-binding protein